jgi:hypothetical protein
MRCPLSGTIEDHQLMFDEHRLRNYGTNAAWSAQSSKSNDEMNEKDDKITHLGIVSKPQNVGTPAYLIIRQGHVVFPSIPTLSQGVAAKPGAFVLRW